MRLAAAAVGVLTLALAACGGGSTDDQTQTRAAAGTTAVDASRRSPTASDLVGTWSRIGSAGLVRFSAQGGFDIARNERDLVEFPYASGTYEVAGKTITLRAGAGTTCEWHAALAEAEDPLDEELHVTVVEGGCGVAEGTAFTLVRISLR